MSDYNAAHYALKAAVRRSIRGAGGQEAACHETRIRHHSTMGQYGRPQDAQHCPIDVAVDLDRAAGEPHILRAMAGELGYVVIPLAPAHARPEWMAHLSAIARETGQAMAALADALEDDGRIDLAEVRDLSLRDRLRAVIAACASADAALAVIEQGPALHLVDGQQAG